MVKINLVKEYFIPYMTARVDIKNSGEFNNQVEFLYISDYNSNLYFPDWFKHEDGIGAVLESSEGMLDLKIKCIGDGDLNMRLRGIHAKDQYGKLIQIFINYTVVMINGKNLINENKTISHDDYYNCHYGVCDNDILFIHIEWTPLKLYY